MKTCNRCLATKDLTEFHKNKRSPDGLVHQCKACKKTEAAEYYKKVGPEKIRERTYAWRDKNPEKALEVNRRYEENNKQRRKELRDARRERIREQASAYKKNNKGKVNANTRFRQARLLNATPSWADREAMESKYRLAQFFTDLSGGFVEYHVDHVIPLRGKAVCGLHVEENLQVLRADLNYLKNNKFTTLGEDYAVL